MFFFPQIRKKNLNKKHFFPEKASEGMGPGSIKYACRASGCIKWDINIQRKEDKQPLR